MKPLDPEHIFAALAAAAGKPCRVLETHQNELAIEISPNSLKAVIDALLHTLNIWHLSAITVQNDPDQPADLAVFYHFWQGSGLALCMRVPKADPTLPSIVDPIPGADFYEREAAEMFGIRFTGREEMPPLLLPDNWQDAPPMLTQEES